MDERLRPMLDAGSSGENLTEFADRIGDAIVRDQQTRRTTRVYIAGPMRGYPDGNTPAFVAAVCRLATAGLTPVSPLEVCAHIADGSAPETYMRADLAALIGCDGIALLPGWERSTGARCEAAVAVTLGLAFFDHETGERVAAPVDIRIRGGYERPAEVTP